MYVTCNPLESLTKQALLLLSFYNQETGSEKARNLQSHWQVRSHRCVTYLCLTLKPLVSYDPSFSWGLEPKSSAFQSRACPFTMKWVIPKGVGCGGCVCIGQCFYNWASSRVGMGVEALLPVSWGLWCLGCGWGLRRSFLKRVELCWTQHRLSAPSSPPPTAPPGPNFGLEKVSADLYG